MSDKLKQLLNKEDFESNPKIDENTSINYENIDKTNLPPELAQMYKRRGMLDEQKKSKATKQIPKNITKPTIPKSSDNSELLNELKKISDRLKKLEEKLMTTKLIESPDNSIIIEIMGNRFLAENIKIIE
jgi:hypothetical protein